MNDSISVIAYRFESRQRTRFFNFSRAILPKKNISFTNGQPLKIRFPKWTSPVWCVSRWIKALRWSWLFVFFVFFSFVVFAKKIDLKKGHFLDYFNPNRYPSNADKKVRKYHYRKTYMQYIYHPWYYHWYHIGLCSASAIARLIAFGRKKDHLMQALIEIKYALEHSSFILRAAVGFFSLKSAAFLLFLCS